MIIFLCCTVFAVVATIMSWYFGWQYEDLHIGDKILAHIDYGFKFKRLMYLGDADEYGGIFYDGLDGILYRRGLWFYYKHVEDNVTLLHLQACYHFGPWDWKSKYISWCGINGDLDPKKDLNEAVELALRHVASTPVYLSDGCERFRNPEYHPETQDICDAVLWVRNFIQFDMRNWNHYKP